MEGGEQGEREPKTTRTRADADQGGEMTRRRRASSGLSTLVWAGLESKITQRARGGNSSDMSALDSARDGGFKYS